MKHHRQHTNQINRASDKLAAKPQAPRTQHRPSENRHAATWKTTKTPLLDSHSQTPKLLAKPRGEATTKHKTKHNKNKRNRTISIALTSKTHPLCKTGHHRQVEKHPRTKSNTKLRSETKNTTVTQKPVETLLGLSEPKHFGIEKIEIQTMKSLLIISTCWTNYLSLYSGCIG